MSKKNKPKNNKMVPELRFAEFEGEWEKDLLGNIATFFKGKGISKSNIASDGTQPCIRYGELYTKYNEVISSVISKTNLPTESLVFSQENDVIIPSSGETQEDIATASCILENGIALGGDINIIRSNINGIFLAYYLNNAKKKEIARLAQGISVIHLYSSQLAMLEIEIPKPEEQKKIAACLSSLDDFIQAQSEKLDALKVHKKGMLQQLFPAEGERVPKLRFAEFEGDGEWEVEFLGDKDASIFVNEKTPKKELNIETYVSTENLLPNYGGVKRANKLPNSGSFTQYRKGDILIANIRPYLKKVWFAQKDGAASNDVIVVRAGPSIIKSFLQFILKNDTFIDYVMKGAKGVKMPRGDKSLMKKYPVCVPKKKEQKKIATCLSSIDNLITAQTEKIAKLKAHKKGLMQQLFPSMNKLDR